MPRKMAEKYDNPTKQTWRGWAWNQVKNRVHVGSRVLVLCGEYGHADLWHGTKRGMEVVGVDLSDDCVEKFRNAGGVAIKDKLHRQVWSMKPDAVIADMLGGVTQNSFVDVIHATMLTKCIVWNGLAGRDP